MLCSSVVSPAAAPWALLFKTFDVSSDDCQALFFGFLDELVNSLDFIIDGNSGRSHALEAGSHDYDDGAIRLATLLFDCSLPARPEVPVQKECQVSAGPP